jgi:leucyl-tRNA synthetase
MEKKVDFANSKNSKNSLAGKAIDFSRIEQKWQREWQKKKIFEVKEDAKKKKYYVLDMFPYPSGAGLHMGHAFVFSLGDIFARFKRMQGFNVLYPMGSDAFGLPAENAAIKEGIHPIRYTEKSIKNFLKQQKAMGWSYDWSRWVDTSKSDYYRWDQWIFLKMFEKGIAFRKKAPVNWCPKCQTVLANEQVVNGKCWRHEDTIVEIKHLEQWFFKITDYADELLSGLQKLDWPERAKLMQENWIGKSEGTEILFEINKEKWQIFTTRPDTLFGVTFMVVSAQHPNLMKLVTDKQKNEVEKFLKKIKSTSEKDIGDLEKEGVFTGSYAVHPLTKDKIPVWTGNFVVADYGSGMVMAVPAHDQRDFEFAKKYKIPIKLVVSPVDEELTSEKMKEAYVGSGNMINSEAFDDLENIEAMEHITKALEKKKLGKKTVQYKLRDWLISRQRYWGTPIPIVYCDKCGIVPVDEKDLPVELPEKVKFGEGNPLATNKEFVNTKCPKCKGKARRETDTMDTFVNSSWYFLRYCDAHNDKKIFDNAKAAYWIPIDQYIGGPEHITMHLIYMRFYTKFLRDLGLIKIDEPAMRYFTQGIVHGADGEKMSKSHGNVVEPMEMIEKYGADTLRMGLVSLASSDKDSSWDEKIVIGSNKFLHKVYDYFVKFKSSKIESNVESKMNIAIKQVTELVEGFKHNLAIIKIRELFDYSSEKGIDKANSEKFLKMLHIYCPHIAEELWEKIGGKGFVSLAEWPEVDEKKIDLKLEEAEKNVEKTVGDILNILKIVKEKGSEGEKIYLYVIPNELANYDAEALTRRIGKSVKVFAVNDKKKHDPQGKASKAKPGKPGIFVE